MYVRLVARDLKRLGQTVTALRTSQRGFATLDVRSVVGGGRRATMSVGASGSKPGGVRPRRQIPSLFFEHVDLPLERIALPL